MTTEQQAKYKELADHARSLLFSQQQRVARIDQKGAWHLSSLTVLIGIAGFFFKWITESVLPPRRFLEWILLGLAVLLAGLLFAAWLSFLEVLRTQRIETLRLDEQLLKFVGETRRIDVNYYIAKRSAEAFQVNREAGEAKALLLDRGLRLNRAALAVLGVLGILYFGYRWDVSATRENVSPTVVIEKIEKHAIYGGALMSDNEDTSEQPSTPDDSGAPDPEEVPDPDLDGPSNISVTEGAEPDPDTTFRDGESKKE